MKKVNKKGKELEFREISPERLKELVPKVKSQLESLGRAKRISPETLRMRFDI
jgi:hypothetical protein